MADTERPCAGQACTVYAIAAQKGGAGKTTTAVNLAATIAQETGRPVLAVDLDPQAHLTRGFGLNKYARTATIREVLFDESSTAEAVEQTAFGVNVIPAKTRLVDFERDPTASRTRLREVLSPLRQQYRHVLIDCPPSLGLLTINALVAADAVIIPFETNALGTDGVAELLNTVQLIQRQLNPNLRVAGILANRVRQRTVLAREVLGSVRSHLANRARLFETAVPEALVLQEAVGAGEPVAAYGGGAAARRATEVYQALARELLAREAEQVG